MRFSYPGVPAGLLPKGFVGIDLAIGLQQPLYDPDSNYAQVDPVTAVTAKGNAAIGIDPNDPAVIVAANGGSDQLYVRQGDTDMLQRAINILSAQDYTGGLFVDDAFGRILGTLPMSAVGLTGSAVTPQPSIAISFTTSDTGCEKPIACGVEVADTGLQQGQGMHGTFARADTSIAHLLHLDIPAKGTLIGRVLSETLTNSPVVPGYTRRNLVSAPGANGNVTRLNYQILGGYIVLRCGQAIPTARSACGKRKPNVVATKDQSSSMPPAPCDICCVNRKL